MKDFTASSMTQSFASVTSLPRDVSCEDFDSSTGDKTVTEDFNQQVLMTVFYDRMVSYRNIPLAGSLFTFISEDRKILSGFFKT